MLEHDGRCRVVWLAGTSWHTDAHSVRLPDVKLLKPSMSILGDGGYLSSVAHMTGPEVSDIADALTIHRR